MYVVGDDDRYVMGDDDWYVVGDDNSYVVGDDDEEAPSCGISAVAQLMNKQC